MAAVGANSDSGAASNGERQSPEDQRIGKFNLVMQKKLAAIDTQLGL